ncbi:tol-pal system protein YbgF [Aquamicrobium sp. LC103]|uniref:tol-pal system protein YbgF n=1 Tax=Aquamicrobium sp. LC103 TaxID=1120658 RepID=UPI00063E74BD|nr:tol-pal system protein YbgF [Aquamicrobium sp. LC103]TKT75363.1 tol-pal system protein YbgF [Aquamicrobium sp. LC103]
MKLRTLIGGIIALPLMFGGASLAGEGGGGAVPMSGLPGVNVPLPQAQLPGAPRASGEASYLVAQAGDPRVSQLEEQVRQLTGTLEELNFQILQMQEQLRRMQEDNEFRFQELEQKRSDAGGAPARRDTAQAPSSEPPAASGGQQTAASTGGQQPAASQPPRVEGAPTLGAPSRDFGTITFDADGNVSGAGVTQPQQPSGTDQTAVAALPRTDDAGELYRSSYELILSGDYSMAESGFRDLIERFPGNENEPDAHFWLGEALLAQDKPRDAAEVFLAASKDFPQSRKAPEMLFKLGVSLSRMKQRDVACATFTEVGQRYPQASDALKERVRQEQALASC